MFVLMEGIDGSGKSTVVRLLREELVSEGQSVYLTAEPTPYIRLLKTYGKYASEYDLYREDRKFHIVEDVEPQLAQGATVICDRGYLSSIAYNTSTVDEAMRLMYEIEETELIPDLAIILTLPVEVAMDRLVVRGVPLDERYENYDRLRHAASVYGAVYRDHVFHVSAHRDIEDVVSECLSIISERQRVMAEGWGCICES